MESVIESNQKGERQKIYWAIFTGIVSIACAIYFMATLGFFEHVPTLNR